MVVRRAAVLALALVACGPAGPLDELREPDARDFVCPSSEAPPCATTEPVPRAEVIPRRTLDGVSFTFVVRSLAVPPAIDGAGVGFNLDGLDSGAGDPARDGCEERAPDLRSTVDPAHAGVDAALGALLAALDAARSLEECGGAREGCTGRLLQAELDRAERVLLVEVSEVDDLEDDFAVMVQLFVAAPDEPIVLDHEGRIAPGQSFAPIEAIGIPVPGDLLAGRLRLRIFGLALPFEALPLSLVQPELRADLAADGLRAGAIGAMLDPEELASLWPAEARAEGLAAARAQADLSPGEDGACRFVSVGLAFDAVPAVRR